MSASVYHTLTRKNKSDVIKMANDHIVALAQLETYLITVLETAETAEFEHETPIAWLKAQIHGNFPMLLHE